MSLIPKNVFDDAIKVRDTYYRLCYLVRLKTHGKDKRKVAAKTKGAVGALKRFERDVLFKLTPDVFQRLVNLEKKDWGAPVDLSGAVVAHKPQQALVCRLLELASRSAVEAKRLAHLIVRITLMNQSPVTEIERDLYHVLLLGSYLSGISLGDASLGSDCQMPNHERFGFIRRLITSAGRGDTEAHEYLRLLYRAIRAWRFDLEPRPAREFCEKDLMALLGLGDVIKGEKLSGSVRARVYYSEEVCERLKRARDDEIARRTSLSQSDQDSMEAFMEKVDRLSLSAVDGFLSVMWSYICEQDTPNLVLTGGRDKVELQVPYFHFNGLFSFSFVRECSDGSGILAFPSIKVNVFMKKLCETLVVQHTLNAEGKIDELNDAAAVSPKFFSLFWCVIVDSYAEIVVPTERKGGLGDPRQFRPRLRKAHHAESDVSTVRSHFAKLPSGWRASEEQIKKAIEEKGAPPVPGYTFVREYEKSFPGKVLPYPVAMSVSEAHERMKPTLLVKKGHIDALLEYIAGFG